MKPNDAFHGITTLVISVTPHGQSQGTAFYYQKLGEKDSSKEAQWREVKETWLVTNCHVVLPMINNREVIPDSFSFHLRKIENNKLIWEPITLNKEQLFERTLFHQDCNVDVCVIKVLDLLTDKIKNSTQYMQWYPVHEEQLPGNNNISIEVADDAIVIGYPRGYYDKVHLYPIVKSGIIASQWGVPFQGKPYFLIDAKLFPGSSGSIVVSKPQQIAIVDGKMMYAKEKQFAFLGIYSGDPFLQEYPIEFDDMTIFRKKGFDLGIVWYGNIVNEIIEKGIQLKGEIS
ncbi:MAG: serine protease [Campylobacterota bacterium]|nr:serine protease [Campylobacterota bacterium]